MPHWMTGSKELLRLRMRMMGGVERGKRCENFSQSKNDYKKGAERGRGILDWTNKCHGTTPCASSSEMRYVRLLAMACVQHQSDIFLSLLSQEEKCPTFGTGLRAASVGHLPDPAWLKLRHCPSRSPGKMSDFPRLKVGPPGLSARGGSAVPLCGTIWRRTWDRPVMRGAANPR